ncbi:hypothetical protein CIPAW_01G178800 [Carya illinoinensis]|uniref:Uncharacterized protein n=2 Tax=Carya illinoinensis TaxID=32201 RepID=A0A8T1RN02_CARIL|nr:hypothetical protein CIPAW_01G178800 [Carya illinoinensis]
MEETFINAREDFHAKEDSVHSLSEDRELSREDCLEFSESKSKELVRRINSPHAIILNVKQPQLCTGCNLHNCVLESRIPKHMVSVDEKYLRHCLELININASKAALCNGSTNLRSLKMGILSDSLNPAKIRSQDANDTASFIFECPWDSGAGGVVVSPAGQWIVGTIMGSKSMMNILKSPLFHHFGALDGNDNVRRSNLNDVKGSICYNIVESPSGLSSPQKLKTEPLVTGSHKRGSDSVNKRLVPMSSTIPTCSDQPSSSASACVSQGMLQCTWKGGLPHFVFSADDHGEAYMANLWKVGSTDDKAVDYIYSFYSRKAGQKNHRSCDNESHLVGKMKVSASFTLCPDNSKIMETEFILYSSDANCGTETHTSNLSLRKNKGLSKVVEVFRASHSSKSKLRTFSKFDGSGTMLENCSLESSVDTSNNHDATGGAHKFENPFLPNFELAAIIVKGHLHDDHREETGGWGLKFLKKKGPKQKIDSLESSVHCESCARNTGDCSTSMDILIPAGLHGGPRTENCGPSSLIERWRSGGHCDCGGWDIGCPLTILKTKLSKEENFPKLETQDECKLVDVFKQGSQHAAPPLRMVNVHDGLYFVHFQPLLSVLQSFSIAVAIIHTQNPILRPKNAQ